MRKLMIIAAAITLCAGTAFGFATSGENTKEVNVEVEGTFSIEDTAETAAFTDYPTIDPTTGTVTVGKKFRIDANMESVYIYVAATDLYKADQVGAPYFIPLDQASGAEVLVGVETDPQTGLTLGGSCVDLCSDDLNNMGGLLDFVSDQAMTAPDGKTWTFHMTNEGLFESAHQNEFSHNLDVTLRWFNEDAQLPKGVYSGWVKMVGRLGPF